MDLLLTVTAFSPIEDIIWQGMIVAVGNPIYIGLIVMSFFGIFAFLQGHTLPGLLAIAIPGTILGFAIMLPSIVAILFGLALAFVLYFAVMRLIGR
jgi:hypothetical protein